MITGSGRLGLEGRTSEPGPFDEVNVVRPRRFSLIPRVHEDNMALRIAARKSVYPEQVTLASHCACAGGSRARFTRLNCTVRRGGCTALPFSLNVVNIV